MKEEVFLVLVDDSDGFIKALDGAIRQAVQTSGQVALLSVVEIDGIEAFSGVERVLMDEAFDEARRKMAVYEKRVEAALGRKPRTIFRKGDVKAALLDVLQKESGLSGLVLAAQTREGGRNPLIQYLTSDKGLRKLCLPLTIIPDHVQKEDVPQRQEAEG